MTQATNSTITRRIGSTTYKVKIFFKESGTQTIEDKILQLIQREGLASPTKYGMIDTPQMDRQSDMSVRQMETKITALYERLDCDDELTEDILRGKFYDNSRGRKGSS